MAQVGKKHRIEKAEVEAEEDEPEVEEEDDEEDQAEPAVKKARKETVAAQPPKEPLEEKEEEFNQAFLRGPTAYKLLYKLYTGNVGRHRTKNTWRTAVVSGKNYWSKCFSDSTYGSKEAAFEAADMWRKEVCDREGLSRLIQEPVLTPEQIQYTIGFGEADGCIRIDKTGEVKITFTQCCESGKPPVLLQLARWWGGRWVSFDPKTVPKEKQHKYDHNKRKAWQLIFSNYDCVPLLRAWVANGIIKSGQAKIALAYMEYHYSTGKVHIRGKDPVREKAIADIKELKKLESYQALDVSGFAARLTAPYMAGFFDGDGMVRWNAQRNQVVVKITQASCWNLCYLMRDNFCGPDSRVYDSQKGEVDMWGKCAVTFLKRVKPYCVAKLDQLKLAIRAHTLYDESRYEHAKEIEGIFDKLKMLKRQ